MRGWGARSVSGTTEIPRIGRFGLRFAITGDVRPRLYQLFSPQELFDVGYEGQDQGRY